MPPANKPLLGANPDPTQVSKYAWIAAGAFVAGLAVVAVMIFGAKQLIELRLVGPMFYVVKVPLSLCSAICLFGVLRAYASYRGRQFGGVLELGGPVVVFVLVLLLAPKPDQQFDLTVYVNADTPAAAQAVRNAGRVVMELNGRQEAPIDARGQAVFFDLDPKYRGSKRSVTVEAAGFEMVTPKEPIELASPISVKVRRIAVVIRGQIRGDQKPLAGARVSVGDVSTTSDVDGRFKLELAGDVVGDSVLLEATAPGFPPYSNRAVCRPGENTAMISLQSKG